jgi:hypothetical protein
MCQATVYLDEEKIMEDVMRQVNEMLRLALEKLGGPVAVELSSHAH